MTFKTLLAAAAATALMAGAAQAQNMSQPVDPSASQTGLPSVDSTRPTGADAGATNLPEGQVNGSEAGMSSTDTTTGATAVPMASTGMNADASASATTTLTNGPVADTPENRAKYKPLSRAGARTPAKGN